MNDQRKSFIRKMISFEGNRIWRVLESELRLTIKQSKQEAISVMDLMSPLSVGLTHQRWFRVYKDNNVPRAS